MRQQMDELMGKNRDTEIPSEGGSTFQDFSDPKIDKYYLCGCSPYGLLQGTKSETIPGLDRDGFLKDRSEGMRLRWEALPQDEKDKYGYERDLLDLLEKIVEQHDSRIQMLRSRYERENAYIKNDVAPELTKEIDITREQVTEHLTQAEALGEAGQVDEAYAAFMRGVTINGRLSDLQRRAQPRETKQQYVDEVSGLVYSSTDNEARIADLQAGRQYQAWKQIREKLMELRANPPPRRGGGGGGGGGGGTSLRDRYDAGGYGREDRHRGDPRGRGDEKDDRRYGGGGYGGDDRGGGPRGGGGRDDDRRRYDDRDRGGRYDDSRRREDDRDYYRRR